LTGKADLVQLVDRAVADAKHHGRAAADRTLAALARYTMAPTAREFRDLRVAPLASENPGLPGLPLRVQGLAYSFLHDPQELAGRAIQATVARNMLLQRLDALFPDCKAAGEPAAGPAIDLEAVD
jgi:hypothetical protein